MGRRGIFVFSALCVVVTALSPLGQAVAAAATVPKPVVSTVSPASGPAAGGVRITVTGKNFTKVRRVLFGAAAGSSLKVESATKLLVTAPKHAAGTVNVRVVTAYGTSAVTKADDFSYAAPAASLKWTRWQRVDGNGAGYLWYAGCLTSTNCFALDEGGNVVRWNGSTWSSPKPTPLGKADTAYSMGETSCPTSSFCMIAGEGIAATYSHGVWATATTGFPLSDGLYFQGVSCTSATFCMATDTGYVMEYNGKRWTDSVWVGGSADYPVGSVSCVSASFCVLTTSSGGVWSWNGSAWKQTVTALPGVPVGWMIPVSCVSATWCMAVDEITGDVYTFDGTTWTAAGKDGSSNATVKLVCTAEAFCVAAGPDGEFAEYNGSAWTVSSSVLNYVTGGAFPDLACAGRTCVAVAGGAVSVANTFTGGHWHSQVAVDKDGELDAVSCPTTGFCAALGIGGDALTWHDGIWAAPVPLPVAGTPVYVSCTSATFCLAADWNGDFWRYNGVSWTVAPSVPGIGAGIISLSCANHSFCVAAYSPTSEGPSGLVTYNGTTWTAVKPFDANNNEWSVSCPSTKFCAAVGIGTYHPYTPFATFNGKTWSAGSSVSYPDGAGIAPGNGPLNSVAFSCTSASFCAMSTLNLAADSGVATFNGKTWTLKTLFTGGGYPSAVVSGLSCAPGSKFCVAALTEAGIFTFDGTDWSGPADTGAVSLEYGAVYPAVSCASPKFCMAVQGHGYVSIGT